MDVVVQGSGPVANTPDDQTGDEAYARRLRLSQASQAVPLPPQTESTYSPPEALSPPSPPIQAPLAGVISRAPVRYNLPAPPGEIPASEADLEKALAEESKDQDQEAQESDEAPRSLRPGQKGFAERLMSKYGWSKGSGLGADGSGIINPLRVQVEKRKKKPDSEGGGFADPKGIGKIIGGKKKDTGNEADTSKFGAMSEVVVLLGMVDGMNLDEEFEDSGDGGLMQEIGDECSEKVWKINIVLIHADKFT
jgi:splicing factor 45